MDTSRGIPFHYVPHPTVAHPPSFFTYQPEASQSTPTGLAATSATTLSTHATQVPSKETKFKKRMVHYRTMMLRMSSILEETCSQWAQLLAIDLRKPLFPSRPAQWTDQHVSKIEEYLKQLYEQKQRVRDSFEEQKTLMAQQLDEMVRVMLTLLVPSFELANPLNSGRQSTLHSIDKQNVCRDWRFLPLN